jgi:hypothetical protein
MGDTGFGIGAIDPESLGFGRKQEVIEIDGRRFLVLKELDTPAVEEQKREDDEEVRLEKGGGGDQEMPDNNDNDNEY